MQVNTLFVGKNFVELAAVGSTNDQAAELLRSRPPEGTVIFTTDQFAGRGQRGSGWYGEPGKNIAFSLILYPTFLPSTGIFLLNKMIACTLRAYLAEQLPDAEVLIKWPNDILVKGRKTSGMLIENHLEGGKTGSSVIGIGLNVNQLEFRSEHYGKATSMALVAGREFELRAVLDALLERIEAAYLGLRGGAKDRFEREYLQHLYGYQEYTELILKGEKKTSMIVGVDKAGRLAVEEKGRLLYFGIKEVEFCL